MNSAALRFIPKEKLESEGYSEYKNLFQPSSATPSTKTLVVAGGCFWCLEPPFEKLPGVLSVQAGYSGGYKDKPSYAEVSKGTTGHREVVQITYNPEKVSLEKLLETFWTNIDPYNNKGQFCDEGQQYTSAIYYASATEQNLINKSLDFVKKNSLMKGEVVTPVVALKEFFAAEEEHQDYYKQNPLRYKLYRGNCGRDSRLKIIWGPLAKH